MAAFIAKQMVGNQLKSVKGAMGDKEGGEGGEAAEDGPNTEEQNEMEEVRREAEEKRKEKHRKMEEEREDIRQGIRDKYGIKKKEPEVDPSTLLQEDADGRLGRKKKTPAELAAEANADSEDEDEFSMPKSLDEFKSKVVTSVGEVTEKCTLQ
ncbi:complexin-like [Mizuhopecten yessoensis]|uniref:Complexin-1 n=1 Tax=Mizuhopecten yessoensis TaxID=6573 RepID=A0A210Q9F5_MIZYE|nr:complexin-like [Mizuhopecten yessoensis]XP_021363982.1 complexin-like [Mizuhopecten yessoensis]XP_021363983.1 complexin-like [Mizuhopecten yessoensis]XP_021363984.1 complexin-like [Mizuhopecten yessoensis]XP_021363985.1 complexin-like [Mizuhopecten yessoensis]XP_021363986.1 complexin-like [Mizuhopecten yessoensis]XP_021363987.1 complexin-like [Mizuhopecten yessoensis]XP_021363990.1 complexin-like [Mizuhopecten yessoensis]OWF45345.1 complexin-1 [Mizuhopecten yessoensis]